MSSSFAGLEVVTSDLIYSGNFVVLGHIPPKLLETSRKYPEIKLLETATSQLLPKIEILGVIAFWTNMVNDSRPLTEETINNIRKWLGINEKPNLVIFTEDRYQINGNNLFLPYLAYQNDAMGFYFASGITPEY